MSKIPSGLVFLDPVVGPAKFPNKKPRRFFGDIDTDLFRKFKPRILYQYAKYAEKMTTLERVITGAAIPRRAASGP